MASSTLIRFGGVALILSAGLRVAGVALHPEETAAGLLQPMWIVAHLLLTASFLFGLLGLIGLYLKSAEYSGRLAFPSFLMAFFGTALLAIGFAPDSFFLPAVADAAPQLLSPSIEAGPVATSPALMPQMTVIMAGLLTYGAGHVLVGITILRSSLFPRLVAVLLIIGVIAYIGGSMAGPFPALLGATVFGAAYAWLGIVLREDQQAAVRQAALAPVR